MAVFIDGSVTPGDGGAGPFYWNATSIGPDNNSTVIVPQPGVPGAWVRLPISQTSPIDVSNIASLRSFDGGSTAPIVWLEGYNTPADGGEGMFVYISTDTTSADNGGTIIIDAQNHRYYRERQSQIVSVKWFGATGNGSTNDTAACQNADTFARSISNAVTYFPAGTYMVSQLVVYTDSNWLGDGRNSSIIMSIIGSNTDVIYGNNSNSNWGISGNTQIYVNGCTLRFLTVNGNYNSGTGNTSGDGIAIWGSRPIFQNIFITNIAGNGLRTGWYDQSTSPGVGIGPETFRMEGNFFNIHIDTVGQHGWWHAGPHDSYVADIIVADSSQSLNGGYYGFFFDIGSDGSKTYNIHSWSQTSTKAYAALKCICFYASFSGGGFEGETTGAGVVLTGQGNVFLPDCVWGNPGEGGVNLFMGGAGCSGNVIQGTMLGPDPGFPASVGVFISSTSGDFVNNNVIDLQMVSQENSNIFFGTADGGTNKVTIKAFNTTTATITGTPNTSDFIDIIVNNSTGVNTFKNRTQTGSLSIGSNTSATFTFPFAFEFTPNVQITPTLPTSSMTLPIWISSISTTSVTVYNPNTSASITIDILASASN